jgi:hypothetical protein
MSDFKLEKYYLMRGVELVDVLYEKKFLDQSVNRKDMRTLDRFLGEMLQIQAQSAAKVASLMREYEKDKSNV